MMSPKNNAITIPQRLENIQEEVGRLTQELEERFYAPDPVGFLLRQEDIRILQKEVRRLISWVYTPGVRAQSDAYLRRLQQAAHDKWWRKELSRLELVLHSLQKYFNGLKLDDFIPDYDHTTTRACPVAYSTPDAPPTPDAHGAEQGEWTEQQTTKMLWLHNQLMTNNTEPEPENLQQAQQATQQAIVEEGGSHKEQFDYRQTHQQRLWRSEHIVAQAGHNLDTIQKYGCPSVCSFTMDGDLQMTSMKPN